MKRRLFNLSHSVTTYGKIGQIIPVELVEVIPGDTFQGRSGMLVRFQGTKKPVLTNFRAEMFRFYVPFRLIWDGFESFITKRTGSVPMYTVEKSTADFSKGQVSDEVVEQMLMGIMNTGQTVSQLPFLAFKAIYDEFFRDEDASEFDLGDWCTSQAPLVQAGHRHTYVTNIRAAQAQGDYPEISAPVSSGTAKFTVEKVRDAMRLMRLQERREMFGDRYFDVLRSYGVRANFELLEKPEVLGRSGHLVSFTDVVATGQSTSVSLGEIAGHAIAGWHHNNRRKAFREHGLIMSLLVIRPRAVFGMYGAPIRWKEDYSDFWAPEFDVQTPRGFSGYLRPGSSPIGYFPQYEEYRGMSDILNLGPSSTYRSYFANSGSADSGTPETLDSLREAKSSDFDDLFLSSSDPHCFVQAHHRLRAYRLLSRRERI